MFSRSHLLLISHIFLPTLRWISISYSQPLCHTFLLNFSHTHLVYTLNYFPLPLISWTFGDSYSCQLLSLYSWSHFPIISRVFLRTFYIVDPFRSLFVLRSFRLVCAPDKLTLSLFLRSFYSSSISHTYSCLLLRASLNKLILSISSGVLFSMHFTNYHYLSAATSYLLRPFLISHVNSHRTSFARS